MTTIFAPLTSISKSGISVIRISGEKTISCLQKLGFKGIPAHQKVTFQKIFDPKTSELIDEVLISFFQAPKSFTGEDVAEISIHASPFIVKKIFGILSEEKNVRFAEAGEFSKRAFLNGKLDLVQAEAIPDLIAAETEAQHRQAIRQLGGKLGEIYEDFRFRLIEISAMIEAAIDFPDEDLPKTITDKVEENVRKLMQEIRSHLDDKRIGQKIKDGLSLAIIGAPNVGKSSLINFLAQSDVAIVSEIAGTTRDVVEVHLSIAGIPVRIADTAGLRETEDLIEKEGIRRALKKAKEADLKIVMLDATSPSTQMIEELVGEEDKDVIFVLNKIDLQKTSFESAVSTGSHFQSSLSETKQIIPISLINNTNTSLLLQKIKEKVLEIAPTNSFPAITQERYRVALQNVVTNLENFSMSKPIELAYEDLRVASREIGKITGRVDIENILDVIFSRFCIGK